VAICSLAWAQRESTLSLTFAARKDKAVFDGAKAASDEKTGLDVTFKVPNGTQIRFECPHLDLLRYERRKVRCADVRLGYKK
jgi:hypothetical protein